MSNLYDSARERNEPVFRLRPSKARIVQVSMDAITCDRDLSATGLVKVKSLVEDQLSKMPERDVRNALRRWSGYWGIRGPSYVVVPCLAIEALSVLDALKEIFAKHSQSIG